MSSAARLLEDDPTPPLPAESRANQFVTFSAGGRAYGVDIMAVREIRSWSPTTELPDSAYGACGVLDIRGNVVEVYDLSSMLGGPVTDPKSGHVVLVLSLGNANVGVLADAVSDIIFAENADFRPAPSAARDPQAARVSGLVKQGERLIAVLNLAALFPAGEATR